MQCNVNTTESRGECVGHVGDESERKRSGDQGVDQWQNDEAVHEQTQHDGAEVPAELVENHPEVLSAEDLTPDEEEDANRSEVDDPGGDDHHGVRQAGEKC